LSALTASALSPTFLLGALFTLVVLAIYHVVTRSARSRRRSDDSARSDIGSGQSSSLERRLAAVESASARALKNVGFVRFNAFPDVASELSYALAVLDEKGNGFLVSSIYSREEVRTYAKAIANYVADKTLSSEERAALDMARESRGGRTADRQQSL
jgi:hypothetical protein